MSNELLTPEQINRETKTADIWEKGEPCWKCSGTGYISGFGHVMGGVCFRCGGVGTPLTKRGAAARAFYNSLIRTPVEAVQVGDRVYSEGVPGIVAGAWITVEAVKAPEQRAAEGDSCQLLRASDAEKIAAARERGAVIGSETTSGGETYVRVYEGTSIEGKDRSGMGRSASQRDGTVLAKIDPAVGLAARKTAAEYQLNLTKAGTPRKGTRWAA